MEFSPYLTGADCTRHVPIAADVRQLSAAVTYSTKYYGGAVDRRVHSISGCC